MTAKRKLTDNRTDNNFSFYCLLKTFHPLIRFTSILFVSSETFPKILPLPRFHAFLPELALNFRFRFSGTSRRCLSVYFLINIPHVELNLIHSPSRNSTIQIIFHCFHLELTAVTTRFRLFPFRCHFYKFPLFPFHVK